MPIFSKPITNLTTEDLNELLQENAVENIRLEFKRDDPSKDELLKKLSSFANTYGGWLIVGAEASSSDGRLVALPGVNKISNYKQRIIQWCFDNTSPPIDIAVSEPITTPDDPNKFCYVIYTPESYLTPHFINARRGIYIRTDEYSQRFEPKFAKLEEILHLTERRKSINERRELLIRKALSRFESYVEVSYNELGKNPKGLGAHVILIISPSYPHDYIFETHDLLQTIRNVNIPWRQVGFPRRSQGVISQHESALVLRPASNFSLLEASIWGLLAYSTEIEIAIGRETDGPMGIHLNQFIGHLLVFSEHAKRIFEKVGYLGSLSVQVYLKNIRGVPWYHFPDGFPEEGPKSVLDSGASIVFESDISRLIEKRDGFVTDLLHEIFFSLNWPDATSSDRQIHQLILSGYEYNLWRKPSLLST